jgi:hypothetical protein
LKWLGVVGVERRGEDEAGPMIIQKCPIHVQKSHKGKSYLIIWHIKGNFGTHFLALLILLNKVAQIV